MSPHLAGRGIEERENWRVQRFARGGTLICHSTWVLAQSSAPHLVERGIVERGN